MEDNKLILQTPLLGRQVYLDIINRFPGRFDNPLVWGSVNSQSTAPKVDLLGPDWEPFPCGGSQAGIDGRYLETRDICEVGGGRHSNLRQQKHCPR